MGETAQEVTPGKPLFSFEARREIALSFAEAYLRGAVKIRWQADETGFGPIDMTTGKPLSGETMVRVRKGFNDTLALACGIGNPKPSSTAVVEAIDSVFGMIQLLRSAQLIVGDFLAVSDAKRLDSVEERVSGMERLFQELQIRLKLKDGSLP